MPFKMTQFVNAIQPRSCIPKIVLLSHNFFFQRDWLFNDRKYTWINGCLFRFSSMFVPAVRLYLQSPYRSGTCTQGICTSSTARWHTVPQIQTTCSYAISQTLLPKRLILFNYAFKVIEISIGEDSLQKWQSPHRLFNFGAIWFFCFPCKKMGIGIWVQELFSSTRTKSLVFSRAHSRFDEMHGILVGCTKIRHHQAIFVTAKAKGGCILIHSGKILRLVMLHPQLHVYRKILRSPVEKDNPDPHCPSSASAHPLKTQPRAVIQSPLRSLPFSRCPPLSLRRADPQRASDGNKAPLLFSACMPCYCPRAGRPRTSAALSWAFLRYWPWLEICDCDVMLGALIKFRSQNHKFQEADGAWGFPAE